MMKMSFEIFKSNTFLTTSLSEFRTKLVSRMRYRLISSGIGSRGIATVALVRWDNCCAERDDQTFSKTKMGMLKWEFDFCAIQLKRRGSHVPSIRAGKFLRFGGTISRARKVPPRFNALRFLT